MRKKLQVDKIMSRFIASSDFNMSEGTESEMPGYMGSRNGKPNSAWVRE